MKKKNGFIATSVMFSFFLVFTMLSLLVLASYAHYRLLMNELNGEILNDLNENVISKKYVYLDNCIEDNTFESIMTDINDSSYPTFYQHWPKDNNNGYNYEPFYNKDANDHYVRLLSVPYNGSLSGKARLAKKFDRPISIKDDRKIYVAFNMFRNDNNDLNACTFGKVSIKIGEKTYSMSNDKILCGGYINWKDIHSQIFEVNVDSNDQQIIFETDGLKISDSFIGINYIRVVDITDLYKSGTKDEEMKEYLDSELPYDINENYVLERR